MIELFECDTKGLARQSSKGNQLKWENAGIWYKADYTGYEGLAEYMVSSLLAYSCLKPEEYVSYQTEEILYKQCKYRGCKSRNFLSQGWKMVTLERLFQSAYGEGLNKAVYSISEHADRIQFLAERTVELTGLMDFGAYLGKLLAIDAMFFNEDRHTHNIAVLLDDAGNYHYCPIFDHGASLLSDTVMDYPVHGDLDEMMGRVKAKTFCQDFDEQLDLAEQLYGSQIQFCYGEKEIDGLLGEELYYPKEIKQRVKRILMSRKRKYSYLFRNAVEEQISK